MRGTPAASQAALMFAHTANDSRNACLARTDCTALRRGCPLGRPCRELVSFSSAVRLRTAQFAPRVPAVDAHCALCASVTQFPRLKACRFCSATLQCAAHGTRITERNAHMAHITRWCDLHNATPIRHRTASERAVAHVPLRAEHELYSRQRLGRLPLSVSDVAPDGQQQHA